MLILILILMLIILILILVLIPILILNIIPILILYCEFRMYTELLYTQNILFGSTGMLVIQSLAQSISFRRQTSRSLLSTQIFWQSTKNGMCSKKQKQPNSIKFLSIVLFSHLISFAKRKHQLYQSSFWACGGLLFPNGMYT